ncbi:MAG: hypothetical protein ACYTXY_27110, partial [Nostoc sp.]
LGQASKVVSTVLSHRSSDSPSNFGDSALYGEISRFTCGSVCDVYANAIGDAISQAGINFSETPFMQ